MESATSTPWPYDLGQWYSSDGRIMLGHARLAIQDLSPLGHQPMFRGCSDRFIIASSPRYALLSFLRPTRSRPRPHPAAR